MSNTLPICDKCGQPVEPDNDAYLLEDIINVAFPLSRPGLSGPHRHLLPVGQCQGSPSRAQYLEGQPRDTRPGMRYYKEYERETRNAYQLLLAKARGKTK
ncbi:MAG TPA: hypothetical protein VF837_02875 [Patescibacteria group bacterium]